MARQTVSLLAPRHAYRRKEPPPWTSASYPQRLLSLSAWEVLGSLTAAEDMPIEEVQVSMDRPGEPDEEEPGGLKQNPACLEDSKQRQVVIK